MSWEGSKATYGSRNKFALSIGINSSTVSNILNGKWKENQRLVSDAKWSEVASAIGYSLAVDDSGKWVTANTVVYRVVTGVLDYAKGQSTCSVVCDEAGIGKSYTVNEYARLHSHVYVIEGDKCPTKSAFVRELARKTGVSGKGSADVVLERAIDAINLVARHQPLIVLDEAGDFKDSVFQCFKRLINGTQYRAGVVLIGANALKRNIDRGVDGDKRAFAEVFSRLRKKYIKMLPTEPRAKGAFFDEGSKEGVECKWCDG